MKTIRKKSMDHKRLVNAKKASLSDCRDGGHCKYCIRGNDYSN